MTEATIPLCLSGALCAYLYGLRLNELRVGHHLPLCISAQVIGLLCACWVMGSTPEFPPSWVWVNVIALALMLLHLGATSVRWVGGMPPPETESRRMPLDGLHQ